MSAVAAVPRAATETSSRRWWLLATMTGSLSMIMIDQTVVSVALPTMQHDLALTSSGVQWVVNAYLLLLAVCVALGGRVADLISPARTFRAGSALFFIASALCGIASTEAEILGARGLQGIGAALMIPSTGALIINAFGPKERGKAMGLYTGVSMVFLALGPLIGGLLTEGVSWRAVFFINLPIGIATLVAAHYTIPRTPWKRIPAAAIDWPGIPLLIGGLGTLVLGLMQGQTWGWTSAPVLSLLAAAAVLLPAFLWWETRAPAPLIQLSLYRLRNFAPNSLILAGVQFALVGASVFGAVWSQQVLGFSAIHAGVAMLPLTIPLLFTAPQAGRLFDRVGSRPLLVAGSATIALGLAWLAYHLPSHDYDRLIPGYIAMGIGIGLTISPATTDALDAPRPDERSQASGIIQTVRQVGGVIGIAVLGAIVTHVSHVGPSATPAARVAAGTNGVADAYWTGAGMMAVMAIVALAFVRRRRPVV